MPPKIYSIERTIQPPGSNAIAASVRRDVVDFVVLSGKDDIPSLKEEDGRMEVEAEWMKGVAETCTAPIGPCKAYLL